MATERLTRARLGDIALSAPLRKFVEDFLAEAHDNGTWLPIPRVMVDGDNYRLELTARIDIFSEPEMCRLVAQSTDFEAISLACKAVDALVRDRWSVEVE